MVGPGNAPLAMALSHGRNPPPLGYWSAFWQCRFDGPAKDIDFASLSRFAVPLSITGFCLAMITGLLMFTTHASEFVGMRLFVIKMILITLLLTNAIALRAQSVANGEHSGFVKLQALISIIGWASVIGAGRWLAYT